MTVVLLHGVPETAKIWEPLVAELDSDNIVAISLPGFGVPIPDDFDCTMYSYVDYLATKIAAIDGPVDLVGHDWGSFFTTRLVSYRPANVRSFAVDMGNLSADFEWHDLAKVWQTPGAGEEFMEGMVGASPEDRAALLAGSGVPDHGALSMAEGIDNVMASSILALYRSATRVGEIWGPGVDNIDLPGLTIKAAEDPYRRPEAAAELNGRIGTQIGELPDDGHWWMLSNPKGSADMLQEFWAGL